MHESCRLTEGELEALMDRYTLRTVRGERIWAYEHSHLMRALFELQDRRRPSLETILCRAGGACIKSSFECRNAGKCTAQV